MFDLPRIFWAHLKCPSIPVSLDCGMISEGASHSDIILYLHKIVTATELKTIARNSCLLNEVAEAEEKDIFFVWEEQIWSQLPCFRSLPGSDQA